MTTPTFDNRDGYIWYNGELKPWRESTLHVLSHAVHYGSAVFEGERSYNGKVFKLAEHGERLIKSGEILDMKIPYSAAELDDAVIETLAANNITEGYIRRIAWRGSEMMGVSAQTTRINVAIACWEWPSYFAPEERLKGIRLDLSKWARPAPNTAPTNAKASGLYMICTLSKHEAERKGYADALMLDYRGQVAEATGANVFFIKDGQIHTPKPDCFLDGITRRTVIGLAKARGYEVIERAIMPEEMEGFEECFLTGTAAEVTPVAEIGPYKFTPGQVCKTMMEDYMALVRGENTAVAAE
ncbi:branched-chain amino acid aminotransferase [Thalassospira sp. HJ]|uniref:branched-chain amino acid aminotransferase n=1 Tax=unclassified Thalassospira TaxID=2648997 RepID=UPI0005CE1DAC|nr:MULTISPECIES: branched-chain amino acid aminotransferase [unclassified Thalassospira]KJE35793.1 branched-chain amino acid aminotransferase [Thalassospira sp. HJ]MBC06266.1 branched-chain amino acid aminotransferase [Thalassospira sp.]|tara:strand:+ start:1061 stop:1957 length:897 start_codon:yes stop_codon:yes gene_type:complete